MLRPIEEINSNDILAFEASGKLTHADYHKVLLPAIAEKRRQGPVRLLLHFATDFDGWEMDTLWDDAKLGLFHQQDFSHIAIVADQAYLGWSAKLSQYFVDGCVMHFKADKFRQALHWLQNAPRPPKPRSRLDIIPWPKDKIVILEPHGPLQLGDFIYARNIIDPLLKKHQLNGIVIHSRHLPGWKSLADLVEHFRFIQAHHKKIRRVALVTDTALGPVAEILADYFVSAHVRHYHYDDLDAAIHWACEGDAVVG